VCVLKFEEEKIDNIVTEKGCVTYGGYETGENYKCGP